MLNRIIWFYLKEMDQIVLDCVLCLCCKMPKRVLVWGKCHCMITYKQTDWISTYALDISILRNALIQSIAVLDLGKTENHHSEGISNENICSTFNEAGTCCIFILLFICTNNHI